MKDNCSRKFWCGRAAENIARGMLVAFAALAISGIASAQDKQDKKEEFNFDLTTPPITPPAITPPVGNRLFWRDTHSAAKVMFAFPLAAEFPGQ